MRRPSSSRPSRCGEASTAPNQASAGPQFTSCPRRVEERHARHSGRGHQLSDVSTGVQGRGRPRLLARWVDGGRISDESRDPGPRRNIVQIGGQVTCRDRARATVPASPGHTSRIRPTRRATTMAAESPHVSSAGSSTRASSGAAGARRGWSLHLALLPLAVPVACQSGAGQWTLVDLHPAGATDSEAVAVSGGQQVGSVRSSAGSPEHASVWSGSAASWVDLHPVDAAWSRATGLDDGRPVGF